MSDEDKGSPIDLMLHQSAKSKEDLIELRKAIENMHTAEEVMVEYRMLRAKQRHSAYQHYCDAGFTPVQALELVKSDN